MKGTIIGDIVGSPYEFCRRPVKTKQFAWFGPGSRITDDTVTTLAVSAALLEGKELPCGYVGPLRRQLAYWCRKYPDAGYGGRFKEWFSSDGQRPYGSYGNGAAMRVAPAAWAGETLGEVQALAEVTAMVSHDSPEAVKGAVAVASAIYLARTGKAMAEIRSYIEKNFYGLDRTLAEIRPAYVFSCRTDDSVPEAIEAFLESTSFADAVANAVSLGGDTDTQAAIAGAIAEAYYGVPQALWRQAAAYVPAELLDVLQAFAKQYMTKGNEEELSCRKVR